MEYLIQIGNKFLGVNRNGSYVEVSDVNKAMKGSMHKLNNIIHNCIPLNQRKKCKIINEDKITTTSVVGIKHTVEHAASTVDELIKQIKSIDVAAFDSEKGSLNQKLSMVDQEITDIQHYIEFNKLNAAEGYKAYKLLQDKLLVRRTIKNDFTKYQLLCDAKVSDVLDGTLQKKLEASENKTYAPRVLTHLFMTKEGSDKV